MTGKKLYIWDSVGPVTRAYHNGGGLLIVTAGDPTETWRASDQYVDEDDMGKTIAEADLSKPDWVIEVSDDTPDKVFVFPDAGCC